MWITVKDVGRRVRLRNGDIVTIAKVTDPDDTYPVEDALGNIWTEEGEYDRTVGEHEGDIVSFVDEEEDDE